jgi:hypothetical protein
MSARDSSVGDPDDSTGRNTPEDSRRGSDQAGNALNEGAAPQAISPAKSAWVPADLAEALSRSASEDHSDVVATAFCQGGPLDEMPPGPILAAFLTAASGPHPAADAAEESTEPSARTGSVPGLARCGDNALLGLIRGWRRIASQAAAAELAAVAEFTARRDAEAKSAGEWDSTAISAADAEIGAALTLTSRSTHLLMERATTLRDLPATAAALAAGRIDLPKALVFITGLNGQEPDLARTIEAQLVDRAPAQTTGQLRSALNRALLAADPEAAERRRQAEEKQGRIERAPECGGTTATLAGRYLPVPATVAAWNNITATARQLRRSGVSGTLDELRVHVYLALLSGQAASGLTAEGSAPTPDGSSLAAEGGDVSAKGNGADEADGGTGTNCAGDGAPAGDPAEALTVDPAGTPAEDPAEAPTVDPAEAPTVDPAGTRAKPGAASVGADDAQPAASPSANGTGSRGSLTGSVNLTVPLATLLGLTDSPGELGGFGPITAFTARDLAMRTIGAPGVHWCVTVIGKTGEPVGHGCATPKRRSRHSAGWAFTIDVSDLAGNDCAHTRQSSHYRPPPLLQHLLQIRNQRCTAPGCRIAAERCDEDHTKPYDQGGRTCECNLGPLCRYHHRVKQSEGWRLEQPAPGVFVWVTPSGRFYTVGRESYAA